MSKKRTGIHNLAYMGVESTTPPQFLYMHRAPTQNDYAEYVIGTLWLYVTSIDTNLWMLTAKSNYVATWSEIATTSDATVYDGQLLIGSNDGTAVWNNLTAGSNITITNGANGITIAATGGGGGTGAEDFVTDAGTATISGNTINILGDSNITTSGAGSTVTLTMSASPNFVGGLSTNGDIIALSGDITSAAGDVISAAGQVIAATGLATAGGGINATGGIVFNDLTAGVVQSDASGNLTSSNGTDGQVLIGGGSSPVWSNITAGANVTVVNGANSVTISATGGGGGGGAQTFHTDSGDAIIAGTEITVAGGLNINTSGSSSTVTVNLDNSPSVSGTLTAAGDITSTAGDIVADTGDIIATTGALGCTGTLVVGGGGANIVGGLEVTGTARLASYTAGVMQTSATGYISSDNGTDGQILIGGGTAPAWADITSTGGTITVTPGANSINIESVGAATTDIPIGSIVRFDTATTGAAGWVLCDGSAISQTTYSTLFSRVGHIYNYPTYSTQTTTNTYNRMIVHNQLTGAEGLWVAVGAAPANGGISYSTDGTTWNAATSPFTTTSIRYVAHNGQSGADGLWVACNGNEDGTGDLIATSPDGITWTKQTFVLGSGKYLSSVTHNQKASPDGIWAATINQGYQIYTSTDGITWTNTSELNPDTSTHLYNICFNATADKFGVYSTNSNNSYSPPKIYYKEDPTAAGFWNLAFSFQSHAYGGEAPYGLGMTVANGKFIFAGNGIYNYASPQVFTSDTGISYRSSGACLSFYGDSSPRTPIVIGGDVDFGYIAGVGIMYYSKDGLDWVEYPFAVGGLSVQGSVSMTSNNYAQPDRINILNSGATIQVGKTALNTATEFYLPILDDRIIRIL